jgi:acyl-CoA synthetase (AMP-forming)/AMP-acid ligase II
MAFSPYSTIVERLAEHAANTPDQLAFQFLENGETETASLNFAALERCAQAVAGELLARTRPGQLGLMFQPGLGFIASFFGCLMAGRVAVPLYPPKRREECAHLRQILQAAGAGLVLCDAPSAALLTRFAGPDEPPLPLLVLDWLDDAHQVAARAAQLRAPAVRSEDIAFLQFTSGSTGQPKGVIISHANIMANQQWIRRAFGHDQTTRVLGWLPFYHDMGLLGTVMQPVFLGRPCVLMPPMAFIQKPLRWLQAIAKYRITTSGGPNFGYELCIKAAAAAAAASGVTVTMLPPPEKMDLSCWHLAFSGAEPVRAETLARFAETFGPWGFSAGAFYPCYGMAETTLLLTGIEQQGAAPLVARLDAGALEAGQACDWPADSDEVVGSADAADSARSAAPDTQARRMRQVVCCGQTGDGHRVVIVDPDSLAILPENRVGEIWASGPSVAQGYWHNADATHQSFRATHPAYPGQSFLRTGDLGFMRGGNLFVTGRLKTLLIINGRKYYPHDIEASVITLHPAFRAQAAVFSDEQTLPPRIVLVQEVYAHLAKKLDVRQLRQQILGHVLGQHGVKLDEVVLTPDRIPQTSSGKTRHAECCRLLRNGQFSTLGQNPA